MGRQKPCNKYQLEVLTAAKALMIVTRRKQVLVNESFDRGQVSEVGVKLCVSYWKVALQHPMQHCCVSIVRSEY